MEGTEDIIDKIIENIYGDFLPEATSVLLYLEKPVGFAFANVTGGKITNIPLVAINKEYRGKGFASEGLRLAVIEAKKILCQYGENEIYLRCNITNPASLAVMKKNGAVIHHQDDKHYFTRIKF